MSWNQFRHHDKTMLVGSSDSAIADRGKLRVTLHHNLFEALSQRVARVRFGQVHVYDNLYRIESRPPHVYSWGAGIESAIRAENNLDGTCDANRVELVAAYNAVNDPDLDDASSFTPATAPAEIQPTAEVPDAVRAQVGARARLASGRLGR